MMNTSLKNKQVLKPSQNVCSSKKQSHIVLPSHEYQVNQCVVYKDQGKTSKGECTAHDISMYNDKNCQHTQCVHMRPKKPAMKSSHMQSVKPAVAQSTYKKFS